MSILSAIEILLLGAAHLHKGLPPGNAGRQACHAKRSLRRIKSIPSVRVAAATAKKEEPEASLILPCSEKRAATLKTKQNDVTLSP
ncbi:MAG: hypothetical protein PW791_11935 [Neorhizobium sp.]|jgi:hypothetical protein|nr:hypothetical protein [Neorhizobium sp.]